MEKFCKYLHCRRCACPHGCKAAASPDGKDHIICHKWAKWECRDAGPPGRLFGCRWGWHCYSRQMWSQQEHCQGYGSASGSAGVSGAARSSSGRQGSSGADEPWDEQMASRLLQKSLCYVLKTEIDTVWRRGAAERADKKRQLLRTLHPDRCHCDSLVVAFTEAAKLINTL